MSQEAASVFLGELRPLVPASGNMVATGEAFNCVWPEVNWIIAVRGLPIRSTLRAVLSKVSNPGVQKAHKLKRLHLSNADFK
jgi:hypothetical protein